jgi:hypothetical protein
MSLFPSLTGVQCGRFFKSDIDTEASDGEGHLTTAK